MANTGGIAIDNYVVAVAPVQVLGPNNAVGSSQPASVLADGGIHLSTVTFAPVLDAFGNPLPDGSTIIAAAFYCAARDRNFNCVPSAGGQIVDGTPSPTDSRYKVFPVQNGTVSVTHPDQNVTSSVGQHQKANIVLLEPASSGRPQSPYSLESDPVTLSGLPSEHGLAH